MFRLFSRSTKADISPERKKQLKELIQIFKIRVKSLSNLDRALTHTSFIKKSSEITLSYERLEFLGDAILNAAMAHILYDQEPNSMEGRLTMIRASLVDETTLSEIGLERGILKYVKLGKGETLSDSRAQHKVSADIMEALIATVYLDFGFGYAKKFVERLLKDHIKRRLQQGNRDFKTRLQKWSLATFKQYPEYKVLGEKGPDHNKEFEIQVSVGDTYQFTAKGRSKKEAEQRAAKKLLLQVENNENKEKGN